MKRARILWAIAISAAIAGGCTPQTSANMRGRVPRIISLAPSLTEIAFAIGCGNRLVADTDFDDYPSAARALPHVADTRTANLEAVVALHPTAVVALRDQEAEGSAIERQLGVPVEYLPNRDLSDLSADINGVAQACRRSSQGRALAGKLAQKIASIKDKPHPNPRPRVLYLLGLPGFAAGGHTFLGDMIDVAGGANVAADSREPYPDLNTEAIVRADPDVLVVARDTPFGADIQSREPWRSLKAVRDGRVLRPPSDDIMERNGPRIVEGLSWLRTAIH